MRNSSKSFLRVALNVSIALFALSFFFQGSLLSAANEGETLYKSKCVACHAADGSGNTPIGKRLQVRDLRLSEVQKLSDAEMSEIITKGKGKMPAYASLKPAQVAQLVAYMRDLAKKK